MSLWHRPTLDELAARYLAEQQPRVKPKTYAELERLWQRTVLPGLAGGTRLSGLTEEAVSAWHHRLSRTPYLANRALNALAHALNRAERWGWRRPGTNPCRYVRRYPERPRERHPSPAELTRLAAALRRLVRERAITEASAAAIRALALTGCRRNEVLRLAWEPGTAGALGWVDLAAGALRYHDSKGGPKVVPLTQAAAELFRSRAAGRSGSPWAFPGHRTGRPLAGIQRAWERACEAADVRGACPHSLRHTFATQALEAGTPERVVAALLGQRDLRSTAAYLHPSLSTLRAAAEAAAANLAPMSAA